MWIEAGVIAAIFLLPTGAALLTLRHIAIILERQQNARRRMMQPQPRDSANRRIPGYDAGATPPVALPPLDAPAPGGGTFLRSGE